MLPKLAVLKTEDGYLTPKGDLTRDRARAARLEIPFAQKILAIPQDKYTRFWGMSLEECSKAERRKGASADAHLVLGMQLAKAEASIAQALQQADEYDRMAQLYRKLAAQLRAAADLKCN